MTSMTVLLSARDVAAHRGGRPLFEGVSLEVQAGEVVALTGPNGAGKSTLLRVLLGLARPSGGTIARPPGVRVGYVPQLDPGDPGLPIPASSVVLQGLGCMFPGARLRREARAALADAGYAAPHARRYDRLSGGERRRVLLARAMVRRPQLLALDEPTAGVDPDGERAFVDRVRAHVRGGAAGALWVCHGPGVASHADRVLHLEAGALRCA
jgi:zinc transport system ATP-binding protein